MLITCLNTVSLPRDWKSRHDFPNMALALAVQIDNITLELAEQEENSEDHLIVLSNAIRGGFQVINSLELAQNQEEFGEAIKELTEWCTTQLSEGVQLARLSG